MTTKIHMLADTLGRPLRLIVTAARSVTSPRLRPCSKARPVTPFSPTKAYDSNALRKLIAGMDAEAVIPSNRSRKVIIPHDAITYKHRNRIERCFNRLKHFRRFATRYDRRTVHFKGFAYIAAAMIWLR